MNRCIDCNDELAISERFYCNQCRGRMTPAQDEKEMQEGHYELVLDISGNPYVKSKEDIKSILANAIAKIDEYDGFEIRLYYGPDNNNCGRIAIWEPGEDRYCEQTAEMERRWDRAFFAALTGNSAISAMVPEEACRYAQETAHATIRCHAAMMASRDQIIAEVVR